jgi:putative nucleotidyltransferase with HDIG domain
VGKWEELWVRYGSTAYLVAGMVVLYFFIRPGDAGLGRLQVGERAPEAIVAPFDVEYVDRERTEAERRKAESEVRPVFTEVEGVKRDRMLRYGELLDRTAELAGDQTLDRNRKIALLQDEFPGFNLFPTVWIDLLEYYDNPAVTETVPGTVDAAWNWIVAGEDQLGIIDDPLKGFDIVSSRKHGVDHLTPGGVATLAEAQNRIEEAVRNRTRGAVQEPAVQLARELLDVNLVYNAAATDKRVLEARAEVPDWVVTVPAGEEILREGEVVTPQVVPILNELYRRQSQGAFLPHLGALLLAFLSLLFLTRYLRRFHTERVQNPRAFGVILLLLVGVVAMAKGLQVLETYVPDNWGDVQLALPVAMLGMLLSVLMSARLALVPVGIASLLAGHIMGNRVDLTIIFFLAGMVGAYRVVSIRERNDMLRAGWRASVAAVVAYAATAAMDPVFSLSSTYERQFALGAAWAFSSGILSYGFAISLLPLLEDLLGITTDLKLLEFTAKTDIRRELEEKAPGTYQHCQHVATLAESVAESIGANPLLCKVGALYHDVGKIRKPQYFSENQVSAADKRIHSKISPNLSCLLIRNHVKEGLEIADEFGLPEAVRDAIAQHHGTTLISFFYDKALSANPGGKVKESDFRYAGPKPQTIETAIIMLADSVEAASRSLSSYTHGEIQLLVRKVINDKFMDGQFEECNLTLKELHTLSDSFAANLGSLLHRRISYPSRAMPSKAGKEARQRGGGEKETARRAAAAADG